MGHRTWRSQEYVKVDGKYAEREDRQKSKLIAWLMQHQDIAGLVKVWKKFERWTFSLSLRMQTLIWGSLFSAVFGLIYLSIVHIPAGLIFGD
jgi:hypothetical protein